MIKTLKPQNTLNGKAHRKENNFHNGYKLLSFDGGEFHEIMDIRVYRTDRTCSACLWYCHAGVYCSGSAKASGYGYDKEECAVKSAFIGAGFIIEGSSHTSPERLCEAVAKWLCLENWTIVRSHG